MCPNNLPFKAILVAFLLSSSVAYFVLRVLSEERAGCECDGTIEGFTEGVEGGSGGRISLTILVRPGSELGATGREGTGIGVVDLRTALDGSEPFCLGVDELGGGKLVCPVLFILKTGLVGAAFCCIEPVPVVVLEFGTVATAPDERTSAVRSTISPTGEGNEFDADGVEAFPAISAMVELLPFLEGSLGPEGNSIICLVLFTVAVRC